MPSTTSTVNGTKKNSYLSRVLSVNGGSSKTEKSDKNTVSSKWDNDNNNNNPFASRNGSFRRSSSKNLKRANEELRSHVTRLKAEIELEKIKSKQTHRDKVADIKRMKDQYERANSLSIEAVTQKMKNLSEAETKKLRESLNRDKDAEIKQIIKFKDEEIKTLRKSMHEETERLNRQLQYATSSSSRRNRFGNAPNHDDNEIGRLKIELTKLSKENENLEDRYSGLLLGMNQKNEMMKKIKVDHERELQKILRQARRENSQSVSELQTLRKSLQDKDAEISRLDSCVLKVTEEKEHFEEKFDKNVLLSSSFTADKNDHPRSLQSKNAELKNQLDAAYLKIRQLEKDNLNSTGNHTFDLSKSFRLDSKVKQLKTRNSELVAIAKKLEEKAKNVQIEFDDYRRDVENQEDSKGKIKASFSKQRAKDLTEHARAMLIKEQEIEKLKQNSPRIEELEASLHLSEKERLRLERQLKSPPITPRISEEEYNTLKESKNKIVKEFSDFQQLHTSCLQIKEDLSKKLKLLKEINQQLESKEEECVALSKSLMTTQQEMGFLKREMAEEQHRHQQIKKQNEIQRLSLKNMEEENEKLSRKIQSMIKLEKDFDILKDRMKEKEEEYNQLSSEMEYCKQTISTLNKKLSLHKERLENLLLEKTDVQNRLVERDLEIDKLHQELSDFQTHHGSQISDMQRELHEARQQNQLLRKTTLKLNQQIRENTNMVFHSVAVQTNSDHHNNNKISSNHYRLSDNVFDSPKEPLMASSTANENTPNNHVTIKITKPAAASSVENSEIEDENFSIKSDNLMDFAAKRIDELAISQSDATSISDAQPPPPFMSNISGITSHDHDVIKSRHDDDTDDDVSSVEELQCDDENDAMPRERLPEEQIENQDLQLRNLDDKDDFPVKLFQAKYTYDPSLYSPNADHEMELPLIAGQYLYIYGDVDKDGFYIGETKNGERGLIPSNLIQRVEDEFAINEDLPFDVSDSDLSEAEYLANTNRLKAKYNYHKHGQPVTSLIDDRDLIMSLDTSKDNFVEVPWPTDVEIERQMGDSVIVKWNIPEGINTRDIQGYSIQVDGEHRQTVLGSARTKALISNLNLDKVTRVSVCTVTNDGRESDDTESSIIVGGSQVNGTTLALDKDLKPKPSNTKLVRRASEDEIIANFFEQLKKVATTATNKSISSPRPLSMTSPRLPEPEDDKRPQQDQTTSMEQLQQIDGDETHPTKPDLNSEDDEKPRIINPENQTKPRIYNPENEEKPRTFNPENDPNFQRLSLPEGERIVISDDELSVIMEETESNDDILTSNNLDIPNQQARGLRASPDGEENTEISNLIRANQLQEDSYELITEETLEQKFSKRQNSEPVHEEIFEQMYQTKQEHQPADLPLFDFQPPETNTSEALAESDEITDDSPSMNSALTKKTEFEQRINKSLKLLDTGEINNRKTIDPNLLSHQTDEDSLGSIDQGITKRDLSRDSPTNSIIEDSMGRNSSSSNETSNLRNSETYDFGEDVDMLYSEGEDLSPILSRQNSMSKSSRQSNEHFTLKNNDNHSNVTTRKDRYDTRNSESQPGSAKSTPRSRGNSKRNSLIDTLSSASHENGYAIGKQPGSSQSTPRLLSGRNSILDSESLSMGLLNDSKRTDDRNSIRIDKETSSLNSTPRSISKHSSKRNSENEFSIDHKNEKLTPRLLSSKRSSFDSDFSDLLPPDSIHSHTSKTSENNITKSTSSRKSSKRDSKKNSENSSVQDFDAIDDHVKVKSNNSTPRLSSTRSSKRNSLSLLASDFPLESLDIARSDGSPISLESLTKQHATSGSENSTPRDTSGRSSKDDKKEETSQDISSARSKKSDSRSNSKKSTPRISSGRKSGEENIDEHSQDLSSARLNASKRSDKLNNLLNVENAPSPRDEITKTKSPKLPYDVTYGSFGHGQNDTIEPNMEESTRSTLKTEKEQSVELGESDNEEQQLTNSISSSRKDEIRNSLLKGLKNQFKKSGNKKLSKSNSNTSSIIEDISSLKSLLKDGNQASNKSSIKDGNKVVRSHSESSRKSTTLRSEKEKSQSTEKDFFSLPSSVQSSPHISDKRKSKPEKETDLRKNSFSSNHSRPPLQSQQSRDSKKAFDSRKSSRVSPDFSQSTDKDVNSLPNSINGSPRPQLSKKWFNSKNNSPSTKFKSDHDSASIKSDKSDNPKPPKTPEEVHTADGNVTITKIQADKITDLHPIETEGSLTVLPKRNPSISSISSQESEYEEDSIESEFALSSMKVTAKDFSSSAQSHSLNANDEGESSLLADDDDSEILLKTGDTKGKLQKNETVKKAPWSASNPTPRSRQSNKSDGNSAPSSTGSARRSLKYGASDTDSQSSDKPIKITKPIKDMYSLAGYDVSDDEFDVTPMVALDDTDLGITEPKQQNDNKQEGIISPDEVDNTVEAIDYETLEEETIDERQNERVRIFIAIYSYDPITMSPNTEYNSEELAFKKDDLIQIIGEMGEDGFYFGKIDGKSGYVPSNLVAEINLDDNTIIDSSIDENLDQVNDTKNKSDSFDLSHMLKPSKVHSDEEDENQGLLSELNKSLSNSVPILSSTNQHEDDKTTNNENLPTAYSLPELQNSSEDESGRDSGRKRADPYKLKPRLMVALFNYDPAVSSPNVDSEIELSFAAGEKMEVYGEMDEDGFFSGKLNGRKGLIPSNFVSDRKEESKTSLAISSSQESLETKNKKKKKNLFKSMSKAISKFKSK